MAAWIKNFQIGAHRILSDIIGQPLRPEAHLDISVLLRKTGFRNSLIFQNITPPGLLQPR